MPIEFDIYSVIAVIQEAGNRILSIFSQGFGVYEKADESPLTYADLLSHKTIIQGLTPITPDLPVFSEESSNDEISNRLSWETYWLIDPLERTKEFVKRNVEFIVNVALIHKYEPVFGVVYS